MILLKTEEQIDGIRRSCKLLAQLLEYMDGKIAPGMSTWYVDQKCHDFIVKHGGKPAFLHFEGFPGSVCVSVNEEVIHGIPKKKHIIHDGDIVTIDAGIDLKGYFSDSA
ncbi:MAG: M24 family metallopeptidase, partial [Spirochaetales bacterium]|nr:M24 family metallopeptidase [Spirochaetales bacterium]